MPDTTTKILAAVVVIAAATFLVFQRVHDAPQRVDIALLESYFASGTPTTDDCPAAMVDGQMATCDFFARYQYGDATIELADNTTLVDSSDHVRFDVGRVVVDGDVTLTARDVKIVTDGVVSVVHFSWLNTMNVSVISGTATVDQGGKFSATVTAGNAVTVDTLPPYDAIAPTLFSLDTENVKAFYDWALGR